MLEIDGRREVRREPAKAGDEPGQAVDLELVLEAGPDGGIGRDLVERQPAADRAQVEAGAADEDRQAATSTDAAEGRVGVRERSRPR